MPLPSWLRALRALDAVEPLEDARQLVGRDADAGVADRERNVAPACAQRDLDARPRSVNLNAFESEVEDDLLPHLAVDVDRLGERRAVDGEREPGPLDAPSGSRWRGRR